MKRTFGFLLAAATVLTANAGCNITYIAPENINKIFDQHDGFKFEGYDAVCSKLKRANARLFIHGGISYHGNQSIGWASVFVKDMDSDITITNNYGFVSTVSLQHGSKEKADELLWDSINSSIQGWTGIDDSLASLKQSRKRLNK